MPRGNVIPSQETGMMGPQWYPPVKAHVETQRRMDYMHGPWKRGQPFSKELVTVIA
jgi:hypothetical protein